MAKLPKDTGEMLSAIEQAGFTADIKERLICTVGDPMVKFEEEPELILTAIYFAAQLDFDLPKTVYEAIIKSGHLLETIEVGKIRTGLEEIITAEHAGKGLRMLAGSDLMPYIVGEAAEKMTNRQLTLFHTLVDNIDKTKKNLVRSLGLFYQCFEKRGLAAIEKLQYDPATHQHLVDALTQSERIFFLADKVELKRYMAAVGPERFEYMHNLAKAQHIVYGHHDFKVENREYLLTEIKENNEPVYLEDLAIKAEDLIEAEIVTGPAAGQLLELLVDVVHRTPKLNEKDKLLKEAEKMKKSKLKKVFRGVKWLK